MRKAFALLAFSKLNFIMGLGHPDGRSAGHFATEWTSGIAFEKLQFAASRLRYAIFINHSDTYRRAWLAWSLLKDMSCMRILYIYCHPLPESFHAAIRKTVLAALSDAGHQVDLLDLYAEKFDPVLSEEGRRHYHDVSRNRTGLEGYIARLTSAEVL